MLLASAHGIAVNAFKGTRNLKHLLMGSGLNLNHSFFEGLTMMYDLQR
jgi:16S rRNA C1402 (ribose-2'-O) methylase RsmI